MKLINSFAVLVVLVIVAIATSVNSGPILQGQFGGPEFSPTSGDFDGDGKMDPAIYNRKTGVWHVLTSVNGYQWASATFGDDPDFSPVSGDYDGDGKTDLALYKSTGEWIILLSGDNYSLVSGYFGGYGFKPLPGDFDGDKISDLIVYNQSTGIWVVYIVDGPATNSPPNLVVSCSATPSMANVGDSVTWSASTSGGTGSNLYSWTGTDGLAGTGQNVSKVYSTAGPKTATVTVTSGSQTANASGTATVLSLPVTNTSVVVSNGSTNVLTCVIIGMTTTTNSIASGQQKSEPFSGSFTISITISSGFSWSQSWTIGTTYYYDVLDDPNVPGTLSIHGHP